MAGIVTAEKQVIANPSDTYGYTAEQRALAASIRSTVPVAHRTEAEAVATAMAADGRPVSDANPLVVYRMDNERIEIKTANGWGGPPQGIVGYTEMITTSGNIAATAIVLNIPTITFKAGRAYRVRAEGNYYVTSAGGTFTFSINTANTADTAAATTGLTGIASQSDNPNAGMEGRRMDFSVIYRPGVTGAKQIKLAAVRVTGGASLVMSGSTDNPIMLYVEDMGVMQGLV